jgi:hypothetical protein
LTALPSQIPQRRGWLRVECGGVLHTVLALFLAAPLCVALACDPNPPQPDGPCQPNDAPSAELGRGVGGEFVELSEGADVPIAVAPQGGFGVNVSVRSVGLRAADYSFVTADLETRLAGESIGQYTLHQQPLLCAADGGRLTGVVVGFDPDRYKSDDALVALEGQTVELQVNLTDDTGATARASQSVVVHVGG